MSWPLASLSVLYIFLWSQRVTCAVDLVYGNVQLAISYSPSHFYKSHKVSCVACSRKEGLRQQSLNFTFGSTILPSFSLNDDLICTRPSWFPLQYWDKTKWTAVQPRKEGSHALVKSVSGESLVFVLHLCCLSVILLWLPKTLRW